MFKRVPGTKDILPDQIHWWQAIETISRSIFSSHNYLEVRPPIIEEASLFNRSLGEATEIVQKQMFLIKREEDLFALRPEGTASVVRAYIENNIDKTCGFVKWYYLGPMFRAERPQKGRLRQFHHIGCEAIGSRDPALDVEVISLAHSLLSGFGIKGYRILVNSLGCQQDKQKLTALLRERLGSSLTDFCADCQERFTRNVFRVLDCKNPACQKLVEKLAIGDSFLCPDCKTHFSAVSAGLDSLQVPYEVSPHLVRGLDYYTRTVFEIKHPGLGQQQDALGAGGRYDTLVKELGGPDIGSIGFAFGVERLLLAAENALTAVAPKQLVYVVALGDQAKQFRIGLVAQLRSSGIVCDTDYENRSIKSALRKANDLGATHVLLIGDDEIKEQSVTVKDMKQSTQQKVPASQIIALLTEK
jgi:histidyl-tRNA synthetase